MELKDILPFLDLETLKRWTERQQNRDWDEVDWTQPKTFTDLANVVRNSGLGGDVREALAKMFEEVSVMVGAGANEEQARHMLDLIGRSVKKGEAEISDFSQSAKEYLADVATKGFPVVGPGAINTEDKMVDGVVTPFKTSFLKLDETLNMFDGVFSNLYLQGSGGTYTLSEGNGNLVKLNLEPNTNYSYSVLGGTNVYIKGLVLANEIEVGETATSLVTIASTGSVFNSGEGRYLYMSTTLEGVNTTPFVKVVKSDKLVKAQVGESYPLIPNNISIYSKSETEALLSDGSRLAHGSVALNSLDLEYGENIFNQEDIIEGFYVNRNAYNIGSNLVASEYYAVSKQIIIDPNQGKLLIRVLNSVGRATNFTFYDINGTYIKGGQLENTQEYIVVDIPQNAKIFVFSAEKNDIKTAIVQYGETLNLDASYYAYPKGLKLPEVQTHSSSDLIHIKSELNNVRFWLPTVKGTLEYNFTRSNRPFTGSLYENDDCWRLVEVWVCNDNMVRTKQYSSITKGEIECAIRVEGAQDFVGGFHGYEKQLSSYILVDGVQFQLGQTWEKNAQRIEFVQMSNLLRHGTEKEVLATHLKHYKINTEGIRLKQEVVWKQSVQLNSAYLGMMPIRRTSDSTPTGEQVTNKFMANDDYLINDVSAIGHQFNNFRQATEGTVWGETSGISAKMSVISTSGDGYMFCQNTADYNKLYFAFVESGYMTEIDEKWNHELLIEISQS